MLPKLSSPPRCVINDGRHLVAPLTVYAYYPRRDQPTPGEVRRGRPALMAGRRHGRRATMKAIAITGQGGLDRVQYLEVERPRLGPLEVLIETRAVALNHLDLFVRNNMDTLKLPTPHVAG